MSQNSKRVVRDALVSRETHSEESDADTRMHISPREAHLCLSD